MTLTRQEHFLMVEAEVLARERVKERLKPRYAASCHPRVAVRSRLFWLYVMVMVREEEYITRSHTFPLSLLLCIHT